VPCTNDDQYFDNIQDCAVKEIIILRAEVDALRKLIFDINVWYIGRSDGFQKRCSKKLFDRVAAKARTGG
jgi:hypothetical protein